MPSRVVVGPTILENGRKCYVVNGTVFEVPSYVQVSGAAGFGAYGMVCAGVDLRSGDKIAIKKNNVGDGKRVLREVMLLKTLKHANLLSLITFYVGSGRFDDVYLATELLDTDLATVIRSDQQVSEDHGKYFIYQVLRALKYVHSANVIHRDLTPQCILVNSNCDVKLCNFGLTRWLSKLDHIEMTDSLARRWYRSPELILLNHQCDTSVDIWSTGCIFAEILNRKPLFPGADYLSQLRCIVDIVGMPDEEATSGSFQNKEAVNFLVGLNLKSKGAPLGEFVKGSTDPLALDFIGRMLQFDPKRRATAAELMAHPYLSLLHDPDDELVSKDLFDWECDAGEMLSRDDLRQLLVVEAKSVPEEL